MRILTGLGVLSLHLSVASAAPITCRPDKVLGTYNVVARQCSRIIESCVPPRSGLCATMSELLSIEISPPAGTAAIMWWIPKTRPPGSRTRLGVVFQMEPHQPDFGEVCIDNPQGDVENVVLGFAEESDDGSTHFHYRFERNGDAYSAHYRMTDPDGAVTTCAYTLDKAP